MQGYAAEYQKQGITLYVSRDGKDNAPKIIYMFSDPNCPYCNRFWQLARPWVDSGKVQIRHIMVGILSHDSPAN